MCLRQFHLQARTLHNRAGEISAPCSVQDLGGGKGAVSPHQPQSQTTQHRQSEGRCRQSSSETIGTAEPGGSPLSLSHSTTGLVLSPSCTLSHKQDNLLREAGWAHDASLEKEAIQPRAELSPGSRGWLRAFQRSLKPWFLWTLPRQVLPSSSAP